MIYLHEAHADDFWPVGYGIQNPKSIEERQSNCNSLVSKYPELECQLDAVYLDNMENEFLLKSGAWPEGYFFANEKGQATWSHCSTKENPSSHLTFHTEALKFIQSF